MGGEYGGDRLRYSPFSFRATALCVKIVLPAVEYHVDTLFEELDAFDGRWQLHYKTLRDAAIAAKALIMYQEWLTSPAGQHYRELLRDVPDTLAQNEAERKLRERAAELGR